MKLLIITQKVNKNDQLLGFFVSWLERFSKKFEKITVLCLERGNFNLPENIEVISLGKDIGQPKAIQFFNFFKYIIGSKNDYDSVFIHMNPIWVVLGGPSWRLMRKKIFFWYTSGGVTFKLKLAEKFAHIIFTASKESFRLPSNKIMVTGHGIDTELFKPMGLPKVSNDVRILSVGRISPVKNYEILIDACKILKNKNIGFRVNMVGEPVLESDKKYLDHLNSKVDNLGLKDNFEFMGKLTHGGLGGIYHIYNSYDVFVHLSKTGSLDKALLEAMACGMKVLSSSDSARNFLPGNSIFKENDPIDLAIKLEASISFVADPKLREYVVTNHNLNQLINKISKIIAV